MNVFNNKVCSVRGWNPLFIFLTYFFDFQNFSTSAFTAGTSQSSSSSSHHFQINSSPKRRTFCFFTLLVNDFNWHQIVNSASKFQAVLWLWRVRKLWKREFSLLLCSFERRLQHNNLSISHLDNQLGLPLNTFIIDVKSAAVQTVKADHCTIMTEVTLKGSSKVT